MPLKTAASLVWTGRAELPLSPDIWAARQRTPYQ